MPADGGRVGKSGYGRLTPPVIPLAGDGTTESLTRQFDANDAARTPTSSPGNAKDGSCWNEMKPFGATSTSSAARKMRRKPRERIARTKRHDSQTRWREAAARTEVHLVRLMRQTGGTASPCCRKRRCRSSCVNTHTTAIFAGRSAQRLHGNCVLALGVGAAGIRQGNSCVQLSDDIARYRAESPGHARRPHRGASRKPSKHECRFSVDPEITSASFTHRHHRCTAASNE